MLEHNTAITHLSLKQGKALKSTIDCILSKLKSLVDLRLQGEC